MHTGACEEAQAMGDDNAAPATAWNRPDVQDALARGDWPAVLRAFLDGGLS